MSNRFTERLAKNQAAIGCFCIIPDILSAEVLSHAGFDLVVIDLQHGGASLDGLPALIQAVELHGAAPFVRVAWNDPRDIMRAADAGAAGLIVPMVSTVEQAELAADAIRYPPRGSRSYGPMRAARRTPEAANAAIRLFPLIETAAGLANIDEICAVDGVDGVFFGQVDLSLSLGVALGEAYTSTRVDEALSTCLAAAHQHGKLLGTAATGREHAESLIARGADWVSIGADKVFVATGARAAMEPWLAR